MKTKLFCSQTLAKCLITFVIILGLLVVASCLHMRSNNTNKIDKYTITKTLGIRNSIVTGKLFVNGKFVKGQDGDTIELYDIVYEYVKRKTYYGFGGWKIKGKGGEK